VLALLAMPLTWRRIALVLVALAAFVLLFPVPAVRTFYKLELPHGTLQGTSPSLHSEPPRSQGSGPSPAGEAADRPR
jgi:hypothetical protein